MRSRRARGDAIRAVSPSGWPRPRGYANGMLVPPGRQLLFVAGMVGWDERENVVAGGFVPQFEQALRNVLAVVDSAGGGPQDLVRMLVFITERDRYLAAREELADVWRRVMGRHYPAMSLVEVRALVEGDALVEIEAVAAIAGPSAPR